MRRGEGRGRKVWSARHWHPRERRGPGGAVATRPCPHHFFVSSILISPLQPERLEEGFCFLASFLFFFSRSLGKGRPVSRGQTAPLPRLLLGVVPDAWHRGPGREGLVGVWHTVKPGSERLRGCPERLSSAAPPSGRALRPGLELRCTVTTTTAPRGLYCLVG